MFAKLALRNVRRQLGNYLIYFMTVALTVALLFAMNNIIFCDQIAAYADAISEFRDGLTAVVVMISLIVAFVLGYATSFMLRLRKREFGTYLTLGMTRSNILCLFILETMIICMVALVMGLVLGLFIYQGLMAVMMNLMEMTFALSPYSLDGLIFTIALVIGIFILSSMTSAIYLKKVTIYNLIHGDKKVEKTVKYPVVWYVLGIISFGLMIASFFGVDQAACDILKNGENMERMLRMFVIFAVSLILFHVGITRSGVYMLLRRKKLCSRGTNTFVLRQLSGTLMSNSVMIGLLAFLLTFAVIGSNVSFVQKVSQETAMDKGCPYDIIYSRNDSSYFWGEEVSGNAITLTEAEPIIEKYVDIKSRIPYYIYTSGQSDFYNRTRWSGDGYEGLTDSFMAVSEFNSLCEPLGYEPVELEHEFMIVANLTEVLQYDWDDMVFHWSGIDYQCKNVTMDYPQFSYMYFYVVVPDEAVEGMTMGTEYVAYDVTDGRYDAEGLRKDLSYTATETYRGESFSYERTDFRLKEYSRQQENNLSAILVVGALFVALVFLFMAMAILALKTLSGLSDDKRRYQILYRLGAGEREQSRALFRQTFSFFVMPFVVALLISVPSAWVCSHIMVLQGFEQIVSQIYMISVSVALIMAAIYFLYYTATYLIAKRAIVCVHI